MGYKLAELAERFGATLRGDPDVVITGVASLATAGQHEIAFIADKKYKDLLASTSAGAIILSDRDSAAYPGNALMSPNPHLCFAGVASLFKPAGEHQKSGIHPSALIDQHAVIAPTASVGANSVIGAGARIGDHVIIGCGCHIESGVVLGEGVRLYANVVVRFDCQIGEHSIVHPGVVVGADGFGFAKDGTRWIKVPQLGRVIIGANVEIGANSAIDRGALTDTVIGDGVKIDNLVQIAHNVKIGEDSIIAGCVGIAGSAIIGKRCALGGQAGVLGHLEITDDVQIAARTLVTNSIKKPGLYSASFKADEIQTWQKNVARFSHLDEMARRLAQLEKTIKQLTGES